MLQPAAFLGLNGIPATVLTDQAALTHLTEHRTSTGAGGIHELGAASAENAVLALRALHRLGLVDRTPATPHQAVRVHQLIQRATRDTLTSDQHDRLALTSAWPAVERDTVFTTGPQLQQVALRLRATGATDVRGLVLARVPGGG
ncbi:hypothetical protein ACN6LM_004473 [Streptomyces sp. SAS_281]|uniref:hypothetical protein n=1 Tax=Streptomyces sp. SAS_281 TaxID=3412744 RepID=UPI00403C2F1C